MNESTSRDARRQLAEARAHIEALLRVIDRHLLSWTVWPEDTDALDAARAFLSEGLSDG